MRRRARACVVALAALGFAAGACSSATPPADPGYGGDAAVIYPPPPPVDAAPIDLALPDGESPEAVAAAWDGTWKYVSGSQGIACGGTLGVTATSGYLDITASVSGTLLTVVEDGCAFHFDLAGDVASEEPGQACAAWAIPTIPTWTLTMQPDGTLREKLGGRLYLNGDICTISGGSTLVRQ